MMPCMMKAVPLLAEGICFFLVLDKGRLFVDGVLLADEDSQDVHDYNEDADVDCFIHNYYYMLQANK